MTLKFIIPKQFNSETFTYSMKFDLYIIQILLKHSSDHRAYRE